MLLELSIENLALFERAQLVLGPGLNVITGETGAGKSLLVGALELLLGERPRASVVRQGAGEARVEGRFVLSAELARSPELAAWFAENLSSVSEEWSRLAPEDERELILCRALSSDGRTRAWIDHRPVTARVLRELAAHLVEIHGQSEHQRLLQKSEQTRLLDAFGGLEEWLGSYRERRDRWRALSEELARFESLATERRDRLDLLRFQAQELADANLSVEEQRDLLREREVQRHAIEIGTQLGGVLNDLTETDHAALDALKRAQRALEQWQERVESLAPAAAEMTEALAHLQESAAHLARFLEGVEYSPERLDVIEARLFEIEELERKYRTDVAGLVARSAEIAKELDAVSAHEHSFEATVAQVRTARTELERSAERLSQSRRAVRARLKKAAQKSLIELGLERAELEVRVEPRCAPDLHSPNAPEVTTADLADARRFAADGADDVEFLLSANPGEAMQPLRDVASGGETARIMLALRTALAVRQTIPTLVFDEIDAGVGGRLGPRVGEHLRGLARHHQVVCVTHLPAIAALAQHHFKVAKVVVSGRTRTAVNPLAGDARVEEVADMIAGGADQATARAEARRLLRE
jgi:DNA repair protein RecN (Recombination protein N)